MERRHNGVVSANDVYNIIPPGNDRSVLMKNILMILGSPRKKGNTRLLADSIMVQCDPANTAISSINLYDYDIKSCNDCRGCKKGEFVCVIEDGMQEIYRELEKADVVVFGTPIYWFGPTAKMKLMIDRLRPYVLRKSLANKKGALLLPAGSGESDCDLTIEMFKRTFNHLQIEYLGAVAVKAYNVGDVNKDVAAAAAVDKLAARINV